MVLDIQENFVIQAEECKLNKNIICIKIRFILIFKCGYHFNIANNNVMAKKKCISF